MIPFRWRTHSLWLRWLAALTPKDSTRIEVRVSSTHNGRDKLFSLQGSLTTPKCNPAVTWIIFPDTIPISLNQIAKFRTLSNGIEGLLLVDNFRHLQPIGNRKVFLRSVASRSTSLEKVLISEPHEDSNDEDPSFWYFNWSAKRIHNPIKNIRRTIYTMSVYVSLPSCIVSRRRKCFTWIFEHEQFRAESNAQQKAFMNGKQPRYDLYLFMFLCCAIFQSFDVRRQGQSGLVIRI